ncbi:hypothetical protein CCYA_CCYA17G4422 [Cyanidiococcus yangmingshanensis]|uniref:Uncharacterized protein n=1 Tax=Cyanidiococcus yangmingshanensis TaxID=2690220 RepID=A0A7J7IDN2_9RHOD|nr:hypothetical protein F1559_003475 [Cyanidiococcus yangmingshanensis]KAK4533540.1 hypothetical protein CCYA_CCYA17G4422 [Cyanidiococcus yangmingshanensis]
MVSFEIEYRVRLSREEMWNLREDPAFLQWQYEHCSDMSNLEIVEKHTDPEDSDLVTVSWRITPSVPLPQFVLAYVGDGAGIWIEDVHEYRLSKPFFIRFRSHPNMFREYTETRGECEFLEEPAEAVDGQASTLVCIRGEVVVDVPLVGSYVESFVVSNLKSFYTRFPDLVHSYLAAQSGTLTNEVHINGATDETIEAAQSVARKSAEASTLPADLDTQSAMLALQRSPPLPTATQPAPVGLMPESTEAVHEHVNGASEAWWRWN